MTNEMDRLACMSPIYRHEIKHIPPTLLRQLYKVELFAFLRPRHMTRQERIHEGLKIRPPPLCQGIANFPILIDAFTCELRSYRCKALI